VAKVLKGIDSKIIDMVTDKERTISITVEGLLGRPLNDVEKKFSPTNLYVKGSIQIPLPRPRVSIVGSRKASPEGLRDSATIAKKLVKTKKREQIIVFPILKSIIY